MARRARFDIPGGVYHVIARGNEKKAIYHDDTDRHAYLERLIECRRRFEFRLYAFCLMGNHLHLAIERGSMTLARIMLTLHSAYAQGFNRRHERTGHLFQGRYKAFLVEKDAYLLTLVRYIHLNPVRARLEPRPEAYRWSSDRYYRTPRAPSWLDRGEVLAMLGADPHMAAAAYRQLMATSASGYDEVSVDVSAIKGSPAFVQSVLGRARVEPPVHVGPSQNNWTIPRIAELAATSAGLTVEQLRDRGQRTLLAQQRGVAGYVGWKYAGISLARMARFFGREESTLVHAVRRIESALAEDESVAERVRVVKAALGVQEFRTDPRLPASGVQD